MPRTAASLIGVSRTRSSPNSSRRPRVTEKTLPPRPTSIPARKTLGSSRISSASASRSASLHRHSDMAQQLLRVRGGAGLGKFNCGIDLVADLALERFEPLVRGAGLIQLESPRSREWVSFAPQLDFFASAVDLGISLVMAP